MHHKVEFYVKIRTPRKRHFLDFPIILRPNSMFLHCFRGWKGCFHAPNAVRTWQHQATVDTIRSQTCQSYLSEVLPGHQTSQPPQWCKTCDQPWREPATPALDSPWTLVMTSYIRHDLVHCIQCYRTLTHLLKFHITQSCRLCYTCEGYICTSCDVL